MGPLHVGMRRLVVVGGKSREPVLGAASESFTMVERIEEAYTIIEELPPGGAPTVQRAVTTDGLDVVIKTVDRGSRDVPESPLAPGRHSRPAQRTRAGHGQPRRIRLAGHRTGSGVTLKRLLAVERVLSSQSVAELGVQAALALANLHEHGIVHGAVSPDALIWTYEGDVILVDAGLAQAQGGADLTGKAPPRNAAYVSPEEVLGRPLQQASDVYSLGVALYQLVTGRLPFTGRNALAIAKDHASAPVRPPRALVPAVSISLQGIILRAMAKLPEDRYASGRELFEALENELQAPQVPPRPSDVSISPRHNVRLWVAASVVLLAVVLVVAWAAGVFAQKSTVPNVVGATLSNAQARLSRAGFRLGTLGYRRGAAASRMAPSSHRVPCVASRVRRGSAVDLVEAPSATRMISRRGPMAGRGGKRCYRPDAKVRFEAVAAHRARKPGRRVTWTRARNSASYPLANPWQQGPRASLRPSNRRSGLH